MRAQTRPRGRGDRDFNDGPTCVGESSDISVAPHLRSGAVKGRNVSNGVNRVGLSMDQRRPVHPGKQTVPESVLTSR
jgi:hypothetical protein